MLKFAVNGKLYTSTLFCGFLSFIVVDQSFLSTTRDSFPGRYLKQNVIVFSWLPSPLCAAGTVLSSFLRSELINWIFSFFVNGLHSRVV